MSKYVFTGVGVSHPVFGDISNITLTVNQELLDVTSFGARDAQYARGVLRVEMTILGWSCPNPAAIVGAEIDFDEIVNEHRVAGRFRVRSYAVGWGARMSAEYLLDAVGPVEFGGDPLAGQIRKRVAEIRKESRAKSVARD